MKNLNHITQAVLLIAALTLAACGSEDSSGGGLSVAGSCTATSDNNTVCGDYTGSVYTPESIQPCADNGTYSSSECAVANPGLTLIGSCFILEGTDGENITRYYEPSDPANAQFSCEAIQGRWEAS